MLIYQTENVVNPRSGGSHRTSVTHSGFPATLPASSVHCISVAGTVTWRCGEFLSDEERQSRVRDALERAGYTLRPAVGRASPTRTVESVLSALDQVLSQMLGTL